MPSISQSLALSKPHNDAFEAREAERTKARIEAALATATVFSDKPPAPSKPVKLLSLKELFRKSPPWRTRIAR